MQDSILNVGNIHMNVCIFVEYSYYILEFSFFNFCVCVFFSFTIPLYLALLAGKLSLKMATKNSSHPLRTRCSFYLELESISLPLNLMLTR